MSSFKNISVDADANKMTVGGGITFADIFQPLYAAGKEIRKSHVTLLLPFTFSLVPLMPWKGSLTLDIQKLARVHVLECSEQPWVVVLDVTKASTG